MIEMVIECLLKQLVPAQYTYCMYICELLVSMYASLYLYFSYSHNMNDPLFLVSASPELSKLWADMSPNTFQRQPRFIYQMATKDFLLIGGK